MLVLGIAENERVRLRLGETEVWITLTAIRRGRRVRLGFVAPQEVEIMRESVVRRELLKEKT